MTWRDWCIVIGASVLVLAFTILPLMGLQAMVVDTGRAILHP